MALEKHHAVGKTVTVNGVKGKIQSIEQKINGHFITVNHGTPKAPQLKTARPAQVLKA